MADLNPKARALVEAGQAAFRASEGDRARIEQALRARLGPDVLPAQAGVGHAAGSLGWRSVAGLAVGAGFVVGAALLLLRPSAQAPTPHALAPAALPAPAQPSAVPVEVSQPRLAAPPAAETPAPIAPTSRRVGASLAQKTDRLAQEVALLSRATSELRAGHAAQALKALAEHQRKFPAGALSEDRRAAKAQALCLLGRVVQGRAELARLPAQSPAAARAAQVCDASLPPTASGTR